MTTQSEFFESAVRFAGDRAGVLEHDGEEAFFYLYAIDDRGDRVLGAIHVLSGDWEFDRNDVAIRWSRDEKVVGLFIRSRLWAAFDDLSEHGGDYASDCEPEIPANVAAAFEA